VKNLQTEKINFIFDLEDTVRNVILDHLSSKNYETDIAEAIQKVVDFEDKIEALLFRIQKFETTIKMWREQESMRSPDSVQVEIKTGTKEDGHDQLLTLSITNNYHEKISKVNVRTFTKDSIFNFIDPDHGVVGVTPHPMIEPQETKHFTARFRSDASVNVVVNGILMFELDRVEYQVKLPPVNISLLAPTISGFDITDVEYSKTMESKVNYQESLVIKDADMDAVIKYLREKMARFRMVRNRKVPTEKGNTQILWNAGKFSRDQKIFVTVVVRERENQELEVGTSVFSTDKEKGTAFVQDLMNYFKMNYKVVESGG